MLEAPYKQVLAKDNFMFVIVFGLWLLLILYFDPKIFAEVRRGEPFLAWLSVIGLIICVNIFWLIGIYQIVLAVFSRFIAQDLPKSFCLSPLAPKVVILYPTKDDFKEVAILSCLGQDYHNFKVYILDDSIDEKNKLKIDNFVSNHKTVKLIRRESKTGFKAGNLNHGLKQIADEYEYFAISDADGILPKDFLTRLIPYFSLDKNIGFIQSQQQTNPKQGFIFSEYLKHQTRLHYKYFVPAKNKYGYVLFYGHGGIIRMNVWKQVGGFPDSITEDFIFTSEALRFGYRGLFVSDVICYEDFPEDYHKYRKRGERWISGTVDYFLKYYPKLLFSKHATWIEKVDIPLFAGRLLFGLPFILFLFIVSIALPLTIKYFNLYLPLNTMPIPLFESIPLFFSGSYQVGQNLYTSWAFEFFIAMLLYAFSDLAFAVIEWYKKPIKMFNFMAQYTFVCFSTIIYFAIVIFLCFLPLKKTFYVSGIKKYQLSKQILFIPIKIDRFSIFEALVGISLILSVFQTSNIWLFPIAVALIANPLLYKFKWETPGIYLIIILPFILFLLILLIIGLSFF